MPICIGGPHPTIFPEEVVSDPDIDFVVLGEGELSFLELVKSLMTHEDFENVPGIGFSKRGSVVINPPRLPIENLDLLPFPARHLLPMDVHIGFNFLYYGKPATTMIASRGCPFNCSFCQPTLRKIFGRKSRRRSPENVVDEIEYLIKKYDIKLIIFHDDTFTLNRKWVMDVCDEIIKRNLKIKWICNSRADTLDERLLKKLKEAGCVELRIGVESGNQWILDNILKKGITINQVRDTFKLIRKCGFKRAWAFFMVGSPGETRDMIQDSIRLAREIKPTHVNISITLPLPGTELWNIAGKYGSFDKDWSKYDYAEDHAIIDTPLLPKHEVEEMARKFRIEFMEQEKLRFKMSIISHAFQYVIWALYRSLLNRDIKPLATSVKLIYNLTRSFLRYHTFRLSRYHMPKEKI